MTAQAKHESSGSAIAAISLLRSTSSTGGSPLQPSSSAKRNATMSKAAPRGDLAKKPRLGRASSSVARLQGGSFGGLNENAGSEKMKLNTQILYSPSGNESDKENWSPEEERHPRTPSYSHTQPAMAVTGRRPLPSSSSRLDKDRKNARRTPIAGRTAVETSSFLNNRANTAPVGKFGGYRKRAAAHESPLNIYEDLDESSPSARPALDEEVERFMRGNISPSKKSDVDAVAGLLSLSQGNWR